MKTGFYVLAKIGDVTMRSGVYELSKDAEQAAQDIIKACPLASVSVHAGKATPIYIPRSN